MIRKLLLLPIKFYQLAISPLLGPRCRFHPTCSNYAKEAIEKLPLHIAIFKTVIRILKCHPFHPGGYDPVSKKDLKNEAIKPVEDQHQS